MTHFKTSRGSSLTYMLLYGVLVNLFLGVLIRFVNSYMLITLIKIAWISLILYFVYYILLDLSLQYIVDGEQLIIRAFLGLKQVKINFGDIVGFDVYESNIRGVKLSGIGNDRFSFGRNIIDRIGTTYMFVTSSKGVIYLKTQEIVYGISPKEVEKLKNVLDKKGIENQITDNTVKGNVDLYKDKKFILPFISVTVVIILLTLNPFILYLNHKLPLEMPLSFDASFYPIVMGTGKQFAFKQMTYGVLNMIVLLCMYYAAYFSAKYDKKTAYRYIYAALVTSLTFLLLQIHILITFK
jgi:hypothetical protein